VADLDAIAKGDWDNAIVDTGGTGTPGFDESALTPYLKELEEEFGPV
jgi:formylmethanofuran dehydrogenase subunit D